MSTNKQKVTYSLLAINYKKDVVADKQVAYNIDPERGETPWIRSRLQGKLVRMLEENPRAIMTKAIESSKRDNYVKRLHKKK